MPPQEQPNASEFTMNLAVLVWGSMPAARIRGNIVAIPMAAAAASCRKEDERPKPNARIMRI